MFNTAYEWSLFKETIRDLLISMKSFASQDSGFYEEEKKVSGFVHNYYLGCPSKSLRNRKYEEKSYPWTDGNTTATTSATSIKRERNQLQLMRSTFLTYLY